MLAGLTYGILLVCSRIKLCRATTVVLRWSNYSRDDSLRSETISACAHGKRVLMHADGLAL